MRIDAGWIGVSDFAWNLPELSDLRSGTQRVHISDTRWLDIPYIVNSLSLMGNDTSDARQLDAGQLDARRITTLLTEAYQVDEFPGEILALLHDGTRQCKEISLAEYKGINGRLLYQDCIFLPDHTPL